MEPGHESERVRDGKTTMRCSVPWSVISSAISSALTALKSKGRAKDRVRAFGNMLNE